MPKVAECERYPLCQFESDWCDECMPTWADRALAQAQKKDRAMQTTGTFPQLTSKTKGGKKGKGKRG